jgi:hypothetical protein
MKIENVMERILMECAPFHKLGGRGRLWRGGVRKRLRGFQARG